MTGVVLLALFLIKHWVLAHVVDFGYSASRRAGNRYWRIAHLFQCLAELSGTLYILHHLRLEVHWSLLVAEWAGLSFTTLMERKAPLHRLLSRHLWCELFMVALYVIITTGLVLYR